MKGISTKRSRFFWAEVGLLIVLAGVGIFFWFQNRGLSEKALQSASLSELEQITRSHPNTSRPFYYLGQQEEKAQELSAAYDAYTHAADMNPDDSDSWTAAARLAAQLHGDKGAFGILDIFLKRHPDNAAVRLARAQLYLQHRSGERALNDAIIATRADPKLAAAWYIAGLSANAMGSTVAAEDALRQAVTLVPDDWRYTTALAETLAEAKKYDEATELAQKTASQNADEPAPYLTLGKLQLIRAKTPDALQQAQANLLRSAASGPTIPITWQLLARSYAAQSRWQDAKDAIGRAARLSPNDPALALETVRIAQRSKDAVLADQALARYRVLRDAIASP
jgi:tetratricopeptide (TPR) repeat protein